MNRDKITSTLSSLRAQWEELCSECDAFQMALIESDEYAICDIDELVKCLEATPLMLHWQGEGPTGSKNQSARCRHCGVVVIPAGEPATIEDDHHNAWCWYARAKALAKKFRDRGKEVEPRKGGSLEDCLPSGRKP